MSESSEGNQTMNHFSWNENLPTTMERIASVATGPTGLSVINAARRVALALPANAEVSQLVLDLYQPRRLAGRCFKQIARPLSQLGLSSLSHRFKPSPASTASVEWLAEAAKSETIGFLGCNPAHGLRCVLTGILPEFGKPFIAKLGFDRSAAAVKREHHNLLKIDGRYPGVAKTISHNEGENWFLMRMAHLGNKTPKSMMVPGIGDLLQSWLNADETPLGQNACASYLIERACVDQSLRGWHRHMEKLKIRSALIHGDFAIWNLRHTQIGIQAIDWEWAQVDGIAGIDLVHGLRQEAHLVHKLPPPAAIAWMKGQLSQHQWAGYLRQSGWDGELDNLLRIGLLHSHHNALNESQGLLRELGIYAD